MEPQQGLEQKVDITADFKVHKKRQTTIKPITVEKLGLKPGDFLRVEVRNIYDGKKLVASFEELHLSFIGTVRPKYQMTIDYNLLKLLDVKEDYILEVSVRKLKPYKK